MEFVKKMFLLLAIVWTAAAFGCGDDTKSEPKDTSDPEDSDITGDTGDTGGGEDWVSRTASPDSPYKPENIEDIVDNIAEELNQTTQIEDISFAFIPKNLDTYFEMSVLGANRAMDELHVLGTVTAPIDNGDTDGPTPNEQQQSMFDDQVAAGVKGIGVAAMYAEISSSIDTGVDQGVVVITFDSDAADSKRQLYVGTINEEAGKTAGKTVVDLLDGETGTVVILGFDSESWLDGYNRTHEARKVIEAAGNTVVVIHTNWSDTETDETAIEEALTAADPTAVGCLGVFSNSHLCASAAEKAGVDIKVAAFDFDPTTLGYMEEGKIQATHGQRIYYMGYIIPYLLYSVNALGLDKTKDLVKDLMVDDARLDLGLDVIPADGVSDYNDFLEDIGSL